MLMYCNAQEAVDIISANIALGAEKACQLLIEAATNRWAEEEGDYRDDVSIFGFQILNSL